VLIKALVGKNNVEGGGNGMERELDTDHRREGLRLRERKWKRGRDNYRWCLF
jgi:hypothetical protein